MSIPILANRINAVKKERLMAKTTNMKVGFHKFIGKITDKPAITYPFINNKMAAIIMKGNKLIFLFMIQKIEQIYWRAKDLTSVNCKDCYEKLSFRFVILRTNFIG